MSYQFNSLCNDLDWPADAEYLGDGDSPELVMRCITEEENGVRRMHDFHYGTSHDGITFVLWRSVTGIPGPRQAVVWTDCEPTWKTPWLELLGEYWKSRCAHGMKPRIVGWSYAEDLVPLGAN